MPSIDSPDSVDQDFFDVRAHSKDLLKFGVVLAVGDDHSGFGEVQLVFQVFGHVKDYGRDEDCANLGGGMRSNDKSWTVG